MSWNLAWDELETDETRIRKTCAWPDCDREADGRGYCDMHHHRIMRGRMVGAESLSDALAMTALAWAYSDTDEEADAAWKALNDAADAIGGHRIRVSDGQRRRQRAMRRKR